MMYCTECGTQIRKNSKFCSHCGKQQVDEKSEIKEQVVEKIMESKIISQLANNQKMRLYPNLIRKITGWYLAWIVLHLGILLIFSKGIFTNKFYTNDFWPFSYGGRNEYGIGEYDIREFLFYTIFPLAIWLIYSLLRTPFGDKKR
ncbi:MAG: zinc-ribbon domain-containing protein [Flavobacteriaceae bacterium]|nr:zinc-ribbon domain-containing protein [Flavobacteriaceae bacterium]